jgi:SanA protein
MKKNNFLRSTAVLVMKIFLLAIIAVPVFGLITRLVTQIYSSQKIYSVDNAPSSSVAIIFGAGLRRDGSPTAVLRDRVATGVDLYLSGKVGKLLMSGDNRFLDYNEPGAMADYAHQLGVPREDIVLDYAGRRTYDTCYRAKYIFQLKEALLVTQSFHLPRALFTCNLLGIKSTGVLANRRAYSRYIYSFWNLREIPATVVALWDIWIRKPVPVLGKPEPIFPNQDSYNP